MSSVLPRFLTISALTFWALTAVAAAQTAPAVLNIVELERLVASPTPADHQRVRDHFAALAERYTVEAAQHEQIAANYARNPVAKLGNDMAAHCRTLARINRELAGQLRQLATEHGKVAAGVTAPDGPAAPLFATGAPAPTTDDLRRLAATAETPADHAVLGRYFGELRAAYSQQASDHRRLTLYYIGIKNRTEAAHCERVAQLARDGADAAASAAALHQRMATAPGTAMNQAPESVAPKSVASVDPDDHMAVAAGFRAEQARATVKAKEHERLAGYFRMWKLSSEAARCEREAAQARQDSLEAATAADAHEAEANSHR